MVFLHHNHFLLSILFRYTGIMSEMCYRCFKPKSNCLCPYIKEADTGVKFIILMHPKEAFHQRTGTGRITALSLKESEIIIGVDFTQDTKVNALLSDPSYFPVLLYPGVDAYTADSPSLKIELGTRKLLVFVVDGTWPLAAKMVRLSKNLQKLPKLSFTKGYVSNYTFKKEPEPSCLSTIESCYYLVKELQEAGIAKDADVSSMPLVFRKLVEHQMESEKERRAVEGNGPQHRVTK
jgi:DTW domain-containing protein YfiP